MVVGAPKRYDTDSSVVCPIPSSRLNSFLNNSSSFNRDGGKVICLWHEILKHNWSVITINSLVLIDE